MLNEQEKRLVAATNRDSDYQELLQECTALEPDYRRIMRSLSKRVGN